jgi:hypothetical protein
VIVVGECRKLGACATLVRSFLRRDDLEPAARRGGPRCTSCLGSQGQGILRMTS